MFLAILWAKLLYLILGPGTEVVPVLHFGFFYPFAPFSGVYLKVDANDVQEWDLCGMASSSLYIMFCDIYV